MANVQDPSIPEFFSGKNIFVTGGHGFIGKAFTEKVLRSCGNVGNIYWLIREKRGMEPEERLRKALENDLFDKLRQENPEALNKVKVMPGDIQEDNLGLSRENLRILIEDVAIVVHSAATIKFNEPLNVAIKLNVKGTREVCQLALQMKGLKAFCHVSTLYSQQDKKVVEERFYPGSGDWRQAIEIAENFDQNQLKVLCAKFIGAAPNTYVFTKSLAEHCVRDICGGKVPLVVFRPGIVTAIHEDPLPGWADSPTGPFGIVYGMLAGVVKSIYVDIDVANDHIPVDYIVKGMISSIYKKGLESSPLEETPYYNGCYNSVSYGDIVENGVVDAILSESRINVFLYPYHKFIKIYELHLLHFYFLQLLPAFLMDLGYKIIHRKPTKLSMMKLQRKVFENINMYAHFTTNEWKFVNGNFMRALTQVRADDFGDFGVLDQPHPALNGSYGVRGIEYLHEKVFKRKLEEKPAGAQKIRRLKVLTRSVVWIFYTLIGYYCFRIVNSFRF